MDSIDALSRDKTALQLFSQKPGYTNGELLTLAERIGAQVTKATDEKDRPIYNLEANKRTRGSVNKLSFNRADWDSPIYMTYHGYAIELLENELKARAKELGIEYDAIDVSPVPPAMAQFAQQQQLQARYLPSERKILYWHNDHPEFAMRCAYADAEKDGVKLLDKFTRLHGKYVQQLSQLNDAGWEAIETAREPGTARKIISPAGGEVSLLLERNNADELLARMKGLLKVPKLRTPPPQRNVSIPEHVALVQLEMPRLVTLNETPAALPVAAAPEHLTIVLEPSFAAPAVPKPMTPPQRALILLDACSLQKLYLPPQTRQSLDPEHPGMLELLAQTAQLSNVVLIAPAHILDYEWRRHIYTPDNDGSFRHEALERLHSLTKTYPQYLKGAARFAARFSRCVIDDDGNVNRYLSLADGAHPNLVIWHDDVSRAFANLDIRAKHDTFYTKDAGEDCIARVMEESLHEGPFFIITNDFSWVNSSRFKNIPEALRKQTRIVSISDYLKYEIAERKDELIDALGPELCAQAALSKADSAAATLSKLLTYADIAPASYASVKGVHDSEFFEKNMAFDHLLCESLNWRDANPNTHAAPYTELFEAAGPIVIHEKERPTAQQQRVQKYGGIRTGGRLR